MLHIATVHFGSPRWIDIQVRELTRHIPVPFRTWASLQGIDPSYGEVFDHVVEQRGEHAGKLNHLAFEIMHRASDDDLLMFLDGDAFPIADPTPLISAGLAAAPLLAVRRVENIGDTQPHPCFCVTRVGTWRRLPGDWSAGYVWRNADGRLITDVGGNLLRQLQLTKTPWTEVLRSSRHHLHPLFFGVYGDAIYHHGAGFRGPRSRADYAAWRSGKKNRRGEPPRFVRRRMWKRNERISEHIFRRIQADDDGWLAELL